MSISFNVYARELKPISRSELAARCRDLNWVVLMRDDAGQYVRAKGMLANEDRFYGANSRRMAESELRSCVESKRWEPVYETSGGEAIVYIKPNFNVLEEYDAQGMEELSASNPKVAQQLKDAKVQIEVYGGSYFTLQLSQAIARLGAGVWEDPQNGDWEII
jgi:hypothetical protein